jgi:uncharacterized protein
MAKPLIINVVELLRWPGTTKNVAVSLDVVDLEFDDARIVDEPVDVAMHLESMSNGISVQGTASATWSGVCRRCVAELSVRMTVEISELYQKELEDPDAYVIDNDQLNLLPMVRENILLAIPLGPLCRPDCPGLCPHCGIDLAESSCQCEISTADPRWGALEALRGALDDPTE